MVLAASMALLLSTGLAAAATVDLVGQTITWRFNEATASLQALLNGRPVFTLADFGPVGEGRKVVQLAPHHYRFTSPAGGWELALSLTQPDQLQLELTSAQPAFETVSPGLVQLDGAWTGLDLSQCQLAHGQTNWPKTYYLKDSDLFLCAWWSSEVSNGSSYRWDTKQCEPRGGTGSFQPAAEVVYPKRQQAVRERLNLRVGKLLWDVALPALGQPSDYREDLAELAYLDLWSAQSTADLKYLFGVLEKLVAPHVKVLTVLQNWQAGGFDSLLPDSLWLPDYPPSPAVGTVEELRAVAELGRRLGRFAFRTNYAFCRDAALSLQQGLTARAAKLDGQPNWFTRPATWTTLAARQESELARTWAPTASFTDQLASGGCSQAYVDYSGVGEASDTIAGALANQRALAAKIKSLVPGPLGSETLNQQDLIGHDVDYGDFGIMGGHDRRMPVDYKLRRLQTQTMFYGCGLSYRFFELPPFKEYHRGALQLWDDPAKMDDYRCTEIAFGNGAYVCWPAPPTWLVTELILVGRAQQYYALTPVDTIGYQHEGRWQSLAELVKGGMVVEARPWNQHQAAFERIFVRYHNGTQVYANRSRTDLLVTTPDGPLTLPPTGWTVFTEDGKFRACSGYLPGTTTRVDALREASTGLRFLNPRGATIEGSDQLRLWQGDQLLWSVDPETETARVDGQTLPLQRVVPPLTSLDLTTPDALRLFRPTAGVLRAEATDDGLCLTLITPDPQLVSPKLSILGKPGDQLVVTMSSDAGEGGQLYFATNEDDRISERQVVRFKVIPDGQPHSYTLDVGKHLRWAGRMITLLRFDPVHGPEHSTVVLQAVELKLAR